MNGFNPQQRQDSLERRWQERRIVVPNNMGLTRTPPSSLPLFMFNNSSNSNSNNNNNNNNNKPNSFPALGGGDDDLVSTVVPSVTVVLEGRSICQRINLHKHASYHSLAKALRQMFADGGDAAAGLSSGTDLDLTNAVPGHIVAYEDMENDLLLAGDLDWKDFVRVAKRIRIMPAKGNSRKGRRGA